MLRSGLKQKSNLAFLVCCTRQMVVSGFIVVSIIMGQVRGYMVRKRQFMERRKQEVRFGG